MQQSIRNLVFSGLCLSLVALSTNSYADIIQNPNSKFKAYKTTNVSTVLKLDTSNGCLTQVHIGIGEGEPSEFVINNKPLVGKFEAEPGRFALYHTGNMFNFVLMDQFTGKVWQIQWSYGANKRMIIPIQ